MQGPWQWIAIGQLSEILNTTIFLKSLVLKDFQNLLDLQFYVINVDPLGSRNAIALLPPLLQTDTGMEFLSLQ